VSATGGNVTTGTVTVTTTVSPGSTCATNGAIAQSNASPGVLLSCQSNIWSLAQGTTVGWVSMPPSSTTNSFYNRFTPQANISPTQWCITSGYSASAGVCKGISVAAGNTAVESSVLANYTQGFWTWGCNDIGSNYMDSNYQILCVK